ncbi:hypothetical protein FHR89_003167 [Cellulomonas uda]|nr:hypothetical protein [Cellulomonas uda]
MTPASERARMAPGDGHALVVTRTALSAVGT